MSHWSHQWPSVATSKHERGLTGAFCTDCLPAPSTKFHDFETEYERLGIASLLPHMDGQQRDASAMALIKDADARATT